MYVFGVEVEVGEVELLQDRGVEFVVVELGVEVVAFLCVLLDVKDIIGGDQ